MSFCWCCSDYLEQEYLLSGHNPKDAVWVSDRVEVLTPRGLKKLQAEMSMDCQCCATETNMINPVQWTSLHVSPDVYDTGNYDHNYVIMVEKSHANEEVGLVLVEDPTTQLLVIIDVTDGLIKSWSQVNNRKIRVGDGILEVNSETSNKNKLQRLHKDMSLRLVLVVPAEETELTIV